MNTIKCSSWTELKNIVDNRALNLQYSESTSKYSLYVADGITLWSFELSKESSSDLTDFETNYKSGSNAKNQVNTHMQGFRDYDQDLYHKSFKYNVTANTTNEYSESFDVDVYLFGGMYEVVGDVNDGDYIEFSVTDEDNVLGEGAGFTVSKFLETEYVNPDRKYREVMSEDASLVPSSLYLTLTYHSAGSNAPKVIVRYLTRK